MYYQPRNTALEKSGTSTLRDEVERRRWKFIGHILQDPNNDCDVALTSAPEGKRKRGRPKTTWRRTVESEGHKMAGRNGKLGKDSSC